VPEPSGAPRPSEHSTHGNEHWEFDESGFMRRRDMSANDIPIDESERRL